jgi:hypothetical protein
LRKWISESNITLLDVKCDEKSQIIIYTIIHYFCENGFLRAI